jgi:putative transposase
LTLAELKVYVAREISRYHKTPHSTLGMPPLTAWEQMGVINGEPVAPRLPADAEQFRLSFLPGEWRTITREGVELHGLRYQADALRPWIRPRHKAMVRFDPTNLSEVYVEVGEGHIATPLVRGAGMPFSLWEWREVRKQQIANGRMRDEHAVAAELRANRQLIADKAARSNRLRDVRRQARQDSWPSKPSSNAPQTNMLSASATDGELSCRVGR